jgi:hypothetical protein
VSSRRCRAERRKRERERDGTDLVKTILLVAFLYRTEHPLCNGLVADTEFDGGIQYGSTENRVGISSPSPLTGSVSVHRRRRRGYTGVEMPTAVARNE